MPCIKCSNGKWKYGVHGNCQFDTLAKCQAAERAIHAQANGKALIEKLPTNKDCGCSKTKKRKK